jgi:hypothetical protein
MLSHLSRFCFPLMCGISLNAFFCSAAHQLPHTPDTDPVNYKVCPDLVLHSLYLNRCTCIQALCSHWRPSSDASWAKSKHKC